ncbi:sodium/hydrogen exchanger 6, partial [Tanacetum coccineum]
MLWLFMVLVRKCVDYGNGLLMGAYATKVLVSFLRRNDDIVGVLIMAQTNQVMHVQVKVKADSKTLFCSFIYVVNYYVDRRQLWHDLDLYSHLMQGNPWILLGDFNASLNLEDHSSGSYRPNIAMQDFKDCEVKIEVMDINNMGSFAIFQPYRISDHSPCLIQIPVLNEVQKPLNRNPDCHVLREEKAHYLQAFNNALLDEERFLKQKAKVEWLQEGDSNSTYFHKVVKSKCHKSRIEIITDSNGVSFEGNDVLGIFVSHFETFLGVEGNTIHLDTQGIFSNAIRAQKADVMIRDITNYEIKVSMFSIRDNKAPSQDGFTS